MVSARAMLCVALTCLVPLPVAAEMREVPLDRFTSLARLSFQVSHGACSASPGPDGHSVRLTCPEPRADLEQSAQKLFQASKVRAWVHRRLRGVVVEIAVTTPLGGYHLEQRGSRVTIDVGERSKRSELQRLAADVRVPLADEWDGADLAHLDQLFAASKLAEIRATLVKGRRGRRPEVYHLRRADLALLEEDLAVALESYAGTASRYRRRSAGMLAQVRYGEICFLTDSSDQVRDFSFLVPLAARPERTAVLAWLHGARLAFWHGEYEEAHRLARELTKVRVATDLATKASDICNQAIAAMLQRAARMGDHEQVAEVALTYRDELASHPGIEALAPVAYESLMRQELPGHAAFLLQALVSGSDSDELVVEYAADLARAYYNAGKLYRAGQVVEFALAVSPRQVPEMAELRDLRARIAIAEGRGRDAVAAIGDLPSADHELQLFAAESALFHDAGTAAAPVLDRLAQGGVPRSVRAAVELARAEAHLLAGASDGEELVSQILSRSRPAPDTARLAYLRARQLEIGGNAAVASKAYAAVAGDPRWERLARIAVQSVELATKVAPPAPPPDKTVKVRRGPRPGAKAKGPRAGAKRPPPPPASETPEKQAPAAPPEEQVQAAAAAEKTVGEAAAERVEKAAGPEKQAPAEPPTPPERGEP